MSLKILCFLANTKVYLLFNLAYYLLQCISGQFNNMGCHGTKIIVFNLWFNDALEMELDFDTNKQVKI
jgi:hypothetical protein